MWQILGLIDTKLGYIGKVDVAKLSGILHQVLITHQILPLINMSSTDDDFDTYALDIKN